MVGDEESMTKPLRERWQLHRGPEEQAGNPGQSRPGMLEFWAIPGMRQKKKSHCAFSCRPRQGRLEAAGLGWWRGAFSLGLGHCSSLCRGSPCRPWCFSCSHGASLGNAAHRAGEPSNRINSGLFVTQISAGTSAWPREEGEGSFCQLHHRKKHSWNSATALHSLPPHPSKNWCLGCGEAMGGNKLTEHWNNVWDQRQVWTS